MRPLRLLALAPLLVASLLAAADPAAGPALRAFERAMAGQDQAEKKSAIAALANRSLGTDDEVLPLLVRAVADRQARDAAVAALRARTGLQPAPTRGAGGYPAYPSDDSAVAWNGWIAARNAARAAEEKLKETAKAAEEAKQAAADADAKAEAKGEEPTGEASAEAPSGDGAVIAAPAEGDATATAAAEKPKAEPGRDPEFGGLDRITFKTGGSLLCYVLGKRLDVDGGLVSVRLMHIDQGGEETLAAELIARIEEDIK